MKNDLRVSVPDSILLRMQQASTPDLARAEGVRIAQEMLSAARGMVQGVQVSAPLSRYALAADVISGALDPESKKKSEGTAVAKL
jgi:methionine synthase / methylenetetrahydrofolate reductase(NADPH)